MEHGATKRTDAIVLVAMAAFFAIGIQAQVGDPAELIKEKLVSRIKLTKATSSHDDIVTAGDVVVLHKDGLVMCGSDSPSWPNGANTSDCSITGRIF